MEIQELKGNTIKIKWLQDVELEVVTRGENEGDDIETENEVFNKGEVVEVEVFEVDELGQTLDIQFGDGSCVYSLAPSLFFLEELVY